MPKIKKVDEDRVRHIMDIMNEEIQQAALDGRLPNLSSFEILSASINFAATVLRVLRERIHEGDRTAFEAEITSALMQMLDTRGTVN